MELIWEEANVYELMEDDRPRWNLKSLVKLMNQYLASELYSSPEELKAKRVETV